MMNIQPGSTGRRIPKRSEQNDSSGVSEFCAMCARVGQTALMIVVAGAMLYAYITLDNRINANAEEMNRINEELKELNRETASLKVVEAQRTSWSYISNQISRFNLPLIPVGYRQTRKLTVMTAQQAANTPLYRVRHETARAGISRRN